MTLFHPKSSNALDRAKDGRWVLLVSDGSDGSVFGAPCAIACWSKALDPQGSWISESGVVRFHPTAYVELSDLGLVAPTPDTINRRPAPLPR